MKFNKFQVQQMLIHPFIAKVSLRSGPQVWPQLKSRYVPIHGIQSYLCQTEEITNFGIESTMLNLDL